MKIRTCTVWMNICSCTYTHNMYDYTMTIIRVWNDNLCMKFYTTQQWALFWGIKGHRICLQVSVWHHGGTSKSGKTEWTTSGKPGPCCHNSDLTWLLSRPLWQLKLPKVTSNKTSDLSFGECCHWLVHCCDKVMWKHVPCSFCFKGQSQCVSQIKIEN